LDCITSKKTRSMSLSHYGVEKGLCSCRQQPVITAQHERHECGQPIQNYTCICKPSCSIATNKEISDKILCWLKSEGRTEV